MGHYHYIFLGQPHSDILRGGDNAVIDCRFNELV